MKIDVGVQVTPVPLAADLEERLGKENAAQKPPAGAHRDERQEEWLEDDFRRGDRQSARRASQATNRPRNNSIRCRQLTIPSGHDPSSAECFRNSLSESNPV